MEIRYLILLCFLSSLTHLHGQIVADSINPMQGLVNNNELEALRTDIETTYKEVKENRSWRPYDSLYIPNFKNVIWLKFELENTTRDTIQKYLFSNDDYIKIYKELGSAVEISQNGNLYSPSERTNKVEYNFTKISLSPFQKNLFYIRLHNATHYNADYPILYSEKGYWELSSNIRKSEAKPIGLIYIYIISLITIFLFVLTFWLWLREKLYFYYLGYLLFQIIYGFQVLRNTSADVGNIFEYIPKLSSAAFEPVQFVFIGFYILFISSLLTVKKYDKLLFKILTWLTFFCFAYAVSQFIFSYFFFGQVFGSTFFIIIRSIILPLNFILIFWIVYKVKHPLLIYFIIGQSFFFIGAVLSTYIGYFNIAASPGHIFNFTQAPNIIFQLSLLAEVLCFSLALGKNFSLLRKEKEKANDELIAQLQENHFLQVTMNRELDEKIHEKTSELIQLYCELEEEREQKIKNDFNQRIREVEIIALRSQMNPHFIFNSLNAIKHLMMTSRNDDAITYLDDFSSLLREILQSSNRKKITVEEELEILELYLSLERNRIGENFHYDIQVLSRDILSQYQIPPLLLQPIVENAIWHGLHPSQKIEKELKITFDTTEDLKIIIEDNGIGRKESSKKRKLHNSMGTSIVQDRITLFNHLNDQTIHLKITDLEQDGNALGTKIILTYDN